MQTTLQLLFLPGGRALRTHPAGTKIALHSRIYVCVFIRNYHMHYIMSFRYYATIATSTVEATGSLQAQ